LRDRSKARADYAAAVVAASAIAARLAAGAADRAMFANEEISMPIVRSRRLRLAFLGVIAVLAIADGSASAQQPTQQQAAAVRSACRSDYMSHCPNVPTGGMEALQCLRDHAAELSASCQKAVNAATPSTAPATGAPAQPKQSAPPSNASVPQLTRVQEAGLLRRSCGDDFHSYCQGVPLGQGRALQCLVQNESRLSPACKRGLAEARRGQ
jgi:hypothetical protein